MYLSVSTLLISLANCAFCSSLKYLTMGIIYIIERSIVLILAKQMLVEFFSIKDHTVSSDLIIEVI